MKMRGLPGGEGEGIRGCAAGADLVKGYVFVRILMRTKTSTKETLCLLCSALRALRGKGRVRDVKRPEHPEG